MINVEELGARIILGFGEGKLFITESTLFGLVIAVILAVLGIFGAFVTWYVGVVAICTVVG